MVNNLEIIKKMLNFVDPNDFYFVQVLQRKKENPEVGSNSRVIKTYYIRSVEHLEARFDEMRKLANLFNARVYINLNKRNFERLGYKVLKKVVGQMESQNYSSMSSAFDSVAGMYSAQEDKRWIIDLDYDDINTFTDDYLDANKIAVKTFTGMVNKVSNFINTLQPTSIFSKVINQIPTKNGLHLITSPFNLQDFRKKFPQIDVHKNNPTILYIP